MVKETNMAIEPRKTQKKQTRSIKITRKNRKKGEHMTSAEKKQIK